jgi:hypothetical protein
LCCFSLFSRFVSCRSFEALVFVVNLNAPLFFLVLSVRSLLQILHFGLFFMILLEDLLIGSNEFLGEAGLLYFAEE